MELTAIHVLLKHLHHIGNDEKFKDVVKESIWVVERELGLKDLDPRSSKGI